MLSETICYLLQFEKIRLETNIREVNSIIILLLPRKGGEVVNYFMPSFLPLSISLGQGFHLIHN